MSLLAEAKNFISLVARKPSLLKDSPSPLHYLDMVLCRWRGDPVLHSRMQAPYLTELLPNGTVTHPVLSDVLSIRRASENPESIQEIPLATHGLKFTDSIPWGRSFEDLQDTFALHRWGWLLRLLVESRSADLPRWGTETMMDWWRQMESQRDHPGWESYSVSERIVNGILFLSAAGARPGLDSYFLEMARHLSNNLEYYGPDLTGNHVINNARALYIFGRLTKHPYFEEMGRRIFLEESSKLITEDGFLREGSSHYHFLLTRTYLEVFWTAQKTEDSAFAGFLKTLLSGMIRRCWFFLISSGEDWRMPLIGDVSPDFPPQWLISLPWSSPVLAAASEAPVERRPKAAGWADLWAGDAMERASDRKPLSLGEGFHAFQSSGWYRWKKGPFDIFWHADPSGYPSFPSHAHNDAAAFSVFFNGEPLLIDPGRYNYGASALGQHGISARAHNTVVINGLEPFLLRGRHWFPSWYREAECGANWTSKKDQLFFKVQHNGYRRLQAIPVLRREFFCTSSEVKLEESLIGMEGGEVEATTYFHWAPGVTLEKSGNHRWEIKKGGAPTGLEFMAERDSGTVEISPGSYFPVYGKREESLTMVFRRRAILPWRCGYRLVFQGSHE